MKRLLSIGKILVIFGVLFFIFRYLIYNWNQFSSLDIRINYIYVILSFLAMQAAWMTTAWSWGKTLEAFGHKLPYRDIYTIYFRSMVAKYVPGKVWQIAGSTYIAAQKGVPEGATIASVVIGQAYSLLSGLTLVVVFLAIGAIGNSGTELSFFRWSSIPILAFLIILVVKPDLGERLMNWGLRLFKRREISMKIKISTSFWLFWAFLIPWFIFGFSFWLLARGFMILSIDLYLSFTAILTAGTVVGFLAIFAPGGIGVKEASMAALLTSFLGFLPAFALALGFGYRIVTSIIELLAFGLTWVIAWIQKGRSDGVEI